MTRYESHIANGALVLTAVDVVDGVEEKTVLDKYPSLARLSAFEAGEVCEILNVLASKTKPELLGLDEKLPRAGQTVIFMRFIPCLVAEAGYMDYIGVNCNSFPKPRANSDGAHLSEMTHWIPAPEPPKSRKPRKFWMNVYDGGMICAHPTLKIAQANAGENLLECIEVVEEK